MAAAGWPGMPMIRRSATVATIDGPPAGFAATPRTRTCAPEMAARACAQVFLPNRTAARDKHQLGSPQCLLQCGADGGEIVGNQRPDYRLPPSLGHLGRQSIPDLEV